MCSSYLLCIYAYVMFLQFHLPDSYQECMDMVVTGGGRNHRRGRPGTWPTAGIREVEEAGDTLPTTQ